MTSSGIEQVRTPIRIGNCSGFYGDRLSAMNEMLTGGHLDYLTGDYLAELTMLILWKARRKNPDAGYARTFLAQLEEVLGTCLDRGIITSSTTASGRWLAISSRASRPSWANSTE